MLVNVEEFYIRLNIYANGYYGLVTLLIYSI